MINAAVVRTISVGLVVMSLVVGEVTASIQVVVAVTSFLDVVVNALTHVAVVVT